MKTNTNQLPPLGTVTGLQDKALCMWFLPDGFTGWYAAEFDGRDTYFGVVSNYGKTELRYFTTDELDAAYGIFGCGAEMNWRFEPATLQDLLDGTAW